MHFVINHILLILLYACFLEDFSSQSATLQKEELKNNRNRWRLCLFLMLFCDFAWKVLFKILNFDFLTISKLNCVPEVYSKSHIWIICRLSIHRICAWNLSFKLICFNVILRIVFVELFIVTLPVWWSVVQTKLCKENFPERFPDLNFHFVVFLMRNVQFCGMIGGLLDHEKLIKSRLLEQHWIY